MNKPLCLAVLLILTLHVAYAQINIEGKVIDAATNQPLRGVTVSGITNQTSTLSGKDGSFILYCSLKEDSIRFTSAGYEPRNIALPDFGTFISLTPSFTNLNEIVVSGSRDAQRRTEVPVLFQNRP